MSDTNESNFDDIPRKYYPDYEFKRVSGDKVMVKMDVNGVKYGGTFTLEALDHEFAATEDPDFKFVIGKATQFLIEEKK